MSNIDNSPEIPQTNERSLAIEGYIQKAAEKYKENNFQEVIISLAEGDKQSEDFTDKYNIEMRHTYVPLFFDDITDIKHPKYLPGVIEQILTHGHGWTSKTMEIPDDVAIIHNNKTIRDFEFPPLWKKVQALCFLEEWIHVLDQSKEEEIGTERSSKDELEIMAARYLHDNLQIKLPKYFLELHNRKSLSIPIEDHDFDEVDL